MCSKPFPSREKAKHHEDNDCSQRENKLKKYSCRKCLLAFNSNCDYIQHRCEVHRQSNSERDSEEEEEGDRGEKKDHGLERMDG